MNLSAVVIARNEAKNIGRCLQALAWCDDVVVVDDASEDDTAEIARSFGARVLQHRFEAFARQRNWALDHGDLQHPWVLMLDADEVVTNDLRTELEMRLATAGSETAGFMLCRRTVLFGRRLRYSDGFPVWIMRIVRQGRARFVDSGHGEVPVPVVDGVLERLTSPFDHFAFSKGLGDWFSRHNYYAAREARLEMDPENSLQWWKLFSFRREERRAAQRQLSRMLPFRPQFRFCFHYFVKLGILDGHAGYTYARLMALYESMIVLKREELAAERQLDRSPFEGGDRFAVRHPALD